MKQINSFQCHLCVWNIFVSCHELSLYIQLMLIWKKNKTKKFSSYFGTFKKTLRIVTFIHREQNLQSHENSHIFDTFDFFFS